MTPNPNLDLITLDRDVIVARARELASLQVPFVHQGRSLVGIDCVGALAHILQYTGELPVYPPDPVNGELETYLEAMFGLPIMEVSRATPLTSAIKLRVGDILSMQYFGPIRHVSIVVPYVDQKNAPGELAVVHTDAMVGRVTEHRLDTKWLRRIVKVWRLLP